MSYHRGLGFDTSAKVPVTPVATAMTNVSVAAPAIRTPLMLSSLAPSMQTQAFLSPSRPSAASYAVERAHFEVIRTTLAQYATVLNALAQRQKSTPAVFIPLRAMARKIAPATSELNRAIARFADWGSTQLPALQRAAEKGALPTAADLRLVEQTGDTRAIAMTRRLIDAWNGLFSSLTARGKIGVTPPRKTLTDKIINLVTDRPLTTSDVPTSPAPPSTLAPEVTLPHEPEAPVSPEVMPELMTTPVDTYTPEATPAPSEAEPLLPTAPRKIPWLLIGAGALGVGVIGYLVLK